MKLSALCVPALTFVVSVSALHAQIVFGSPQAITGSDNIISAGTYVDALETGTGKSAYTIGDTTFNDAVATEAAYPGYPFPQYEYTSALGDGTIVLSPENPPYDGRLGSSGDSFNGTFTTGNATDNTTFRSVLADTTYNADNFSNITLNNLTVGSEYEVQVFKADPDVSRNTVFNGTAMVAGQAVGNTAELDGADFAVGTFTATGASETFSFAPGVGGTFGEVNDIVLRDLTPLPEPSTYAMMLGGFVLLGLCLRRRLA